MSKSEKLAAFLEEAELYFSNNIRGNLERCRQRYIEFFKAPDDPPPRPEMPECVRELVSHLKGNVWYAQNIAAGVAAIEAYYAQPLKLEVGKVYEDEKGDRVRILWEWPDRGDGYSFLGAYLYHRWCCEWNVAGIVDGPIGKNLIREVLNG